MKHTARELFTTSRETKVYLAGHTGLVGSAILRRLQAEAFTNLLLRTHAELDLTRQAEVEAFLDRHRPGVVIIAAAKVGGIHANSTQPADFLAVNAQIALNIITAAHAVGVGKLINLGSSCIYPRLAPQPLTEASLLTGPLEPTNEAYAIAKIAAIKLCRAFHDQHGANFLSAMPCNLYGPGDNFDLTSSHVLPALIRKIDHAARTGASEVEIWGNGTPLREFLYADDLADAVLFLLRSVNAADLASTVPDCFVNVGSGTDLSIADLARLIADVIGWTGRFAFDPSRPNGTPRKLLDVSVLSRLGWKARTPLREGIARTVAWYREHGTSQHESRVR